ncbi:MAG TPA: hypothetical protein H9776_02235 [Candidatus Mediterraneibacter intestinipullorum]|nr:hypothetical protein [Candidatus Mediterraneibacter avicola]HJA80576.1 hypothetical protein [Candidatus Mediterraneibacter intestinipullorum]
MNILEKILALISVLLLIFCMLAPLKRTELAQKHPWIRRLTGFHTAYGIFLLVTGLAHGVLAGKDPAMITGKLAWMLLLILTLLTPLKKKAGQALWRRIHITLTVSVCALTVIHIVQAVIL